MPAIGELRKLMSAPEARMFITLMVGSAMLNLLVVNGAYAALADVLPNTTVPVSSFAGLVVFLATVFFVTAFFFTDFVCASALSSNPKESMLNNKIFFITTHLYPINSKGVATFIVGLSFGRNKIALNG